jgi:hypothetical protein
MALAVRGAHVFIGQNVDLPSADLGQPGGNIGSDQDPAGEGRSIARLPMAEHDAGSDREQRGSEIALASLRHALAEGREIFRHRSGCSEPEGCALRSGHRAPPVIAVTKLVILPPVIHAHLQWVPGWHRMPSAGTTSAETAPSS